MKLTKGAVARAASRSLLKLPQYLSAGDGVLGATANAAIATRRLPETAIYDLSFGRLPNYWSPRTYTEKIQWRKMFDRNPELAIWCDKLAARDLAQQRAPGVRLPTLLWSGTDPEAIPLDAMAPPYVIKANNRSRANIFIDSTDDLDERRIRARCAGWLRAPNHRRWVYEWGYSKVETKILVEEFLSRPDTQVSPSDIKIFVFNGKAQYVYVRDLMSGDLGIFTPDWVGYEWDRWEPFTGHGRAIHTIDLPAPPGLARAVETAEAIAADIDHLRVDLYEIGGEIYFGEATVYPSSGHKTWIRQDAPIDPYPPDDVDREFGAHWTLPRMAKRLMLFRGLVR